ncbi:2-amino-4-hydroxy-6-hydroxymethyldihydropteridine diphosphokinase [Citricoccus sp.]|uniref:2-amino-4-hydroxy-6- hydroxymethyldihydropteridine diphosphokinase n=1 Tax=Citricoccus sp. TaxID=1978372 RepID=UPI002BAE255A|nr:2-amino-4-hydroxy-6-hydroxymethyldihydropteridine diphosphokinase [Citricoccus sp.]HRO95065.1 2-amino-4-hydroxy-6-hydroxymethyldihydropteridine diphosphokinase [Citricoccus sp.]
MSLPEPGEPAADPLDRVPAAPVPAVLALGANLGDPAATLQAAVRELAEHAGIELTGVSPVAVTAAVGGPAGQPDYLNLVLSVETTLTPRQLLAACQAVEQAHHRTREVRWGPRTLDVDVITYAGLSSDHPELTLPHPRAHERAFVLAPWSWLDPQATLGGVSVAGLAARAADAGTVRRLPGAQETGTGAPTP